MKTKNIKTQIWVIGEIFFFYYYYLLNYIVLQYHSIAYLKIGFICTCVLCIYVYVCMYVYMYVQGVIFIFTFDETDSLFIYLLF